jgi:hypothetical protein
LQDGPSFYVLRLLTTWNNRNTIKRAEQGVNLTQLYPQPIRRRSIMDGDTTTTSSTAQARNYRRRIARLVHGLEADGYLIGPNAARTGSWVKMPEFPRQKDVCGLMKVNIAFQKDETLKAYLMPWLIRNRPYHEWGERIARQPKSPRGVISEAAGFPLPPRTIDVCMPGA